MYQFPDRRGRHFVVVAEVVTNIGEVGEVEDAAADAG